MGKDFVLARMVDSSIIFMSWQTGRSCLTYSTGLDYATRFADIKHAHQYVFDYHYSMGGKIVIHPHSGIKKPRDPRNIYLFLIPFEEAVIISVMRA